MAFIETGSGEGTNFERLFERRPEAFAAWRALNGAIKETMDPRRYELATIAAAGRLRSSYCMLAHGSVLREHFVDDGTLRTLVTDHRLAGLDERDVAVMDFAQKVVDDATSVSEADVEQLREAGLADDEIFDVVLAAAARCFFSKTLDALGVQADARYRELEPELRDALTVGRPIAAT
jgi:uncharacterized peroxidase-related enzyme